MTWKVIGTRPLAGRLGAAIDQRLGYPKVYTRDEVNRGRGRHAVALPTTETQCAILALQDGSFAVDVGGLSHLDGSDVDIDVGSGTETVTIDLSGTVPTVDRTGATQEPARTGLVLRGS